MRRACLALVIAGLLVAGRGTAAETEIHTFELDNGLSIIVKPDNRAPVAIQQIWFPVGSSYERPGITGVSHVLEHMMFKGTENRESGSFSRIISENGGDLNAFTGRDYTAYYEEMGADRLEIAMELEADRLANIVFEADAFDRELQVVREERRLRVEDQPISMLQERFNAVAWHRSPYRQPIIGWGEDLNQLELADVRDWYQDWYGINNATLVVVGDVDPEAIRAMAERHYGSLEPREPPEVPERSEVEPRGERRLTVRHANANPFIIMGYQAPSLNTAEEPSEAYALSVLAQVLDGGDSARLPSELVRGQELAAMAGAGYSAINRLDTHFQLYARPSGGTDLDELEDALRTAVAEVREDGITEAELERAKVQLRADFVYRLDSLSRQAREIGMLETTGIGYEAMAEFRERLGAVTREHVREAARSYLTERRLTVGHLRRSEDADPLPDAMPGTPAGPTTGPGDTNL